MNKNKERDGNMDEKDNPVEILPKEEKGNLALFSRLWGGTPRCPVCRKESFTIKPREIQGIKKRMCDVCYAKERVAHQEEDLKHFQTEAFGSMESFVQFLRWEEGSPRYQWLQDYIHHLKKIKGIFDYYQDYDKELPQYHFNQDRLLSYLNLIGLLFDTFWKLLEVALASVEDRLGDQLNSLRYADLTELDQRIKALEEKERERESIQLHADLKERD